MNLDFFLNLLNALNMGDIINEVRTRCGRSKLNAGETDAILDEVVDYMHEVLKKKSPWSVERRARQDREQDPDEGNGRVSRQVPEPAL